MQRVTYPGNSKWHFCLWSYEFPITSTTTYKPYYNSLPLLKSFLLLSTCFIVILLGWSWILSWCSELVKMSLVHDDGILVTLWPSVEDSQFWWAWPDLEYASSNHLLLACEQKTVQDGVSFDSCKWFGTCAAEAPLKSVCHPQLRRACVPAIWNCMSCWVQGYWHY